MVDEGSREADWQGLALQGSQENMQSQEKASKEGAQASSQPGTD